MLQTAILYPVFVQVLLTVVVLLLMARARSGSMRETRQKLTDEDVRLGRNTWNDSARKAANNYANQFEMPVLFYAVAAFAMLTHSVDYTMVALGWLFVASRIVHAGIHIGPNVILWRFIPFLVGVIMLVAMWVLLALRVSTGA